MKITDYKSVQNVTDLESLIKYCNIDLNLFLSVINGGIDLIDNCNTALVAVSFAKPNVTYAFTHNLGRLPTGFIEVGKSANMVMFNGATPNNITQIYLQSSAAGTGKVLVF